MRLIRKGDDVADTRDLVSNLIEDRQQRSIAENHVILGVVDDVAELIFTEPQVQRMQNRPVGRHREIDLKMAMRVPAERPHPAASRHL